MSGGHFGFSQFNLMGFSEHLSLELDESTFSPECNAILAETVKAADKMAEVIRAVDYLFSGDLGEGSFLEEIDRINKTNG